MSPIAVVVLPSPAFVGVMPGDADELAVGDVGETLDHRQRDLRLVAAVGLELLRIEPAALGDLVDRQQLRLLGDLRLLFIASPRVDGWLADPRDRGSVRGR